MKDILLNTENELQIANGDFVVGESLNQQVGLLLLLNKGELKQYPLTGVGIYDLINTESKEDIKNAVSEQLKDDGLKLRNLELTDDKLYITAEYA
jgi:hypothetical protein